jgi:tetratricopeptide (TPR) repeat protein
LVRLDRLRHQAFTLVADREPERKAARSFVARLKKLSPAGRRLRTLNTRQPWTTEVVAELLAATRRARHENVGDALSWAELALYCSVEADGPLQVDYHVEALAELGNVHRIRGEWVRASEHLRHAERLLADSTGDPYLLANVLRLKASLLQFRREYDEASRCLLEAIDIYRDIRDRPEEVAALVKLALCQDQAGDMDGALDTSLMALRLLPGTDAELSVIYALFHNLVHLAAGQGAGLGLKTLLAALPTLQALGGAIDRARLEWISARLMLEMGDTNGSRRAFRAAAKTFGDHGLLYEVGVIRLEEALIDHAEGDFEQLGRKAADALNIFTEVGVDTERLSALALLRDAAAAGLVSRAIVAGTAALMNRSLLSLP